MDISFMQIMDGKAKFVVVPNDVPELNLKNFEKFFVKEFTGHRISGTVQKTAKINRSLGLVRKREVNFVLPQILCLCYGDGFHDRHI